MSRRRKNTAKFVTTHGLLAWSEKDQRFITVGRDGYWYAGPWSLAMDTASVWEAEDFQFFNDDGSITTATPIAAQNVAVVKGDGIAPGTAVQLKVNVGETAGAAGTGQHTGGWTLQFKKGAGAWTAVGAATDVQYFDSTNLTNTTVIVLANYDLTWGSGGVQRDWGDECEDGVSISQTWSSDYCEICFSIKFDATGTAEDDVITFRMLAPDGSSAVTFGSVPTITMAAAVSADLNISATLATLSIAAANATVNLTREIAAVLATLDIAAQNGVVNLTREIAAAPVSLDIASQVSDINLSREIAAVPASLNIAAANAVVVKGINLTPTVIALDIAAQNAGINASREIAAVLKTLNVTTPQATVERVRHIQAVLVTLNIQSRNAVVSLGGAVAAIARRVRVTLKGVGFGV